MQIATKIITSLAAILFMSSVHSYILISFQYKLTNVASTSTTTLPISASTQSTAQSKYLVLSGYSLQTQQVIDFQMYIKPSSTNSSIIITVVPGGIAAFNFISVYVVFLMNKYATGYQYSFNLSKTFVNISSYSINGSLTEQIGNPVSFSSGNSINYVFGITLLSYFHAQSQANADIYIAVDTNTGKCSRTDPLNQRILKVGIVFISIGAQQQFLSGGVPFYYKSFSVYSNPINSTSYLFNDLPQNFNINISFLNSTYGGFNGNCMIGLTNFSLAGNTSGSYIRDLSFDATTYPISSQNVLHQIDSSTYQSFSSTYQIVCFAGVPCPNNTFYDINTFVCRPCSLSNCVLCYTYYKCLMCSPQYGLDGELWNYYPSFCSLSVPYIGMVQNLSLFTPLLCPALCKPCLSYLWQLNYCTQCLQNNICNTCLDDRFYLYWGRDPGNNNRYRCQNCAIPYMPHCTNCVNSTYCTACNGSQYYLSLQNRLCLTCSNAIQFCLTCSINVTINQFNCTYCIASMFVNSSRKCQSCSSVIPNCLNCYNNTNHCQNCVTIAYSYNPSNNTCVPCNQIFPNCITCTNTACIKCTTGLTFGVGSCNCILGVLQGTICVTITGCTDTIIKSDGTAVCGSCDPTLFNPIPTNEICQCLQGNLINNQCTSITGCITPITPTNSPQYCIFCNVTAGFQTAPVNGVCICPSKYEIQGSICGDKCGDGFLMINAANDCDDGNKINGDGCSSKCKVEVSYQCYNGTKNSSSNCVYIGVPFNLSLNFIQRANGLNQGIFAFNVYPPILNIKKMNLSTEVSLNCQSTQYTINKISYTLGVLQITVDYTQNMEGCSCYLILVFDNNFIISPNTSLSFLAVSRNIPLTLSSKLQMLNMMKFIFNILSYIALGLFVLSLFHKMIGVQLIFSCQIVYLSNCLYKKPSFLLSAMQGFNLVTGGWSFFYQVSDKNYLLPFTDLVQITPYFIENSMIITGILMIIIIIQITLIAYHQITKKSSPIAVNVQDIQPTNSEIAIELIYQVLLFPLTAGFYCVLFLAGFVNNKRLPHSDSSYFSASISLFSLFFTWFVMGTVFGRQLLNLTKNKCLHIDIKNLKAIKKNTQGLKQNKKLYIPLFLLKIIIFTTLIELGVYVSFVLLIFIVFAFILSSFVCLVIVRPYKSSIQNIGAIGLQLTAVYSLFLSILQYFYLIDENTQLLFILVLEGLLMISFTFTLIRVGLFYYNKIYNLYKRIKKERQNKYNLPKSPIIKVQQRYIQSPIPQINEKRINPYSLLGQGLIKNKTDIIQDKMPRVQIRNQLNNSIKVFTDNQDLLITKARLKENLMTKKKKKCRMQNKL